MLPTKLKAIEVVDVGIHSETLAYRMYDRLGKRVEIPTLQTRLLQLKKDEKDHRKTLRAHRRAMFGAVDVTFSEAEVVEIFGAVDVSGVRDRESLIQALHAAIRFEEFGSYFYDRQRHKLPHREARIFLEVLASEGHFHAGILRRQIEAVREMELVMDDRGRAVEVGA